ncbi:MAG: prenyltransferase, partial [Candidatus Kariarchaeaceae archaeon]
MEIQHADRMNLVFMDIDGYPVSLPVKTVNKEGFIQIDTLKGIEIDFDSTVYLESIDRYPENLRFKIGRILGKIEPTNVPNRYNFKIEGEEIEEIDNQNNLIPQIISKLPGGRNQIKEFNTQLADTITTNSGNGLLILHISNITHVHDISYKSISGTLEFTTPKESKLFSILQYSNNGTIRTDNETVDNLLINGRISQVNRETDQAHFRLIPNSISYGSQSNLEQVKLTSKKTSAFIEMKDDFFLRIKYWVLLLRLPLIMFTLIPVIIGSVISLTSIEDLSYDFFILEILSLFFLQSSANLLNDYFDHESKSDEYALIHTKLNAGSRFLQLGLVSEDQVKTYSLISLFLGLMIGLVITVKIARIDVLIIGLAGGLLLVSYTLPPLKLSYRWYGDILFAFSIFPLLLIGSNFVQMESYDDLGKLIVIGLSMGSLILSILFIGNLMSYDAEKAANKITYSVKFGKANTTKFILALLVLHYILQLGFIISTGLSLLYPFIIISAAFSGYGYYILGSDFTELDKLKESIQYQILSFLFYY